MDLCSENSRGDRLIEDYLFSDYDRPQSKSTFGLDQQFAKPIEDEDLFGGLPCDSEDKEMTDNDDPLMGEALDDEPVELGVFAGIENDETSRNASTCVGLFRDELFEDQENREGFSEYCPERMQSVNIDKIFINDYSDADDDDHPEKNQNEINITHNTQKPNAPTLRDKLKQQVLASGLMPRKLKPDAYGMIEIGGEAPCHDTKFRFSDLVDRSSKNKDTRHGRTGSMKWPEYKELLSKRMCAEKRKIWDSFQAPCDNYDEDEEIIGETADYLGEEPAGSPDDEPAEVSDEKSSDEESVKSLDEKLEDSSDEESVSSLSDEPERSSDKESADSLDEVLATFSEDEV